MRGDDGEKLPIPEPKTVAGNFFTRVSSLSLFRQFSRIYSLIPPKIRTLIRGVWKRVKGTNHTSKKQKQYPRIEKRDREQSRGAELVGKLEEIKSELPSPKPELTIFKLGEKKFSPYSTSVKSERFGSAYWSFLSSLYSNGENILQFLKKIFNPPPEFSLKNSQVYTILPLEEGETLYVERKGPPLISIKSKLFPIEKLDPPNKKWRKYSFNWVELLVDPQIDLLFTERKRSELYEHLAKLIRINHETFTQIQGMQREVDSTIHLVETPASKISPFIVIRMEEEKNSIGRIVVYLFPISFSDNMLSPIQVAERVAKESKKFKNLSS